MPELKENLLSHLNHLSLTIGERNVGNRGSMDASADYIEKQFSHWLPTRRQVFKYQGETFANVEASVNGSDEIIVVGAHYDSVPGSPGANDNGSGVAAILAMAEIFKELKLERTIRLVAFANEESPYFAGEGMGSLNYAQACLDRKEKIIAMFSLETMGYFSKNPGSQSYPPGVSGYPDTGHFIAFVANLPSAALLTQTTALFKQHTDFPFEAIAAPESTPGVSLSDHMSFWQMSYPALMITDTAPFRYPHYHTEADTPDKIDLEKFTELVNNLAKTFAALAGNSR